ncbi:ABC transporter ATP-binding protein [Micromonospora mirobrigensis]|uniref:Putative ABC transport system ATP-binding protein n=1 Tax=Micromonospora mirobrigensis TaxID=262898 RepID=A0A1C5AP39_9ACTN|nr:ABC transporter ATP-binding protein [Micromonospora mirobrigensis]SCF46977.1 putative ABC transport system ATP-binding protein [Micromonospora mirobrigensis]
MELSGSKSTGLAGCRGVRLAYGSTIALDDVSFAVEQGETVAVTGPSGCGKTTLLHVLSGLLRPDAGEVYFESEDFSTRSDAARSRLRLTSFGFVLQFGDLVPELTLRENVELPLRVTGTRAPVARRRAEDLLGELGIGDLADRQAGAVSGGQAQRAAVARALVHEPRVVFADEPTGALDSGSGEAVLDCLFAAARERGAAVVMVTHAPEVAERADRVVRMRDGRVLQAVTVR